MNNPEAKTGEIMPKESVVTDKALDENKKLRAVTRGWVTDDKLAALREQFKDITVSTPKEYKACTKAIATLRGLRTRLEKSRQEKNRGDHEKISLRNKEAKRITAVLLEIETPLKEMKLAEDERVAKEKAEKDRVEKQRVDAIKQRIEDNFGQHQIDDLAGKPSAYMESSKALIETYEIDDAYHEFKGEADLLKKQLLERISNIYVAKRQQEEAGKQLLAEKAKLDAQKQEMAAEAKRLEEQQEAFEKERAAWNEKRKAEEEAEKEAEAETGQADEEDATQEPTQEQDASQEPAQEGAGGAEAQEEGQGYQVTDEYPLERPVVKVESVTGPQFYDEPEDEETVYPEDELSAESKEALASYGHRTNREKLVELIQIETGIKEFNDNDLEDLLDLAGGMYWDKKFDGPIRYLAGQVRKELELYESIPE